MNDKDKDLLNENDLVNEPQNINQVQPIEENASVNNLEASSKIEAKNDKVENTPIDKVDASSEKVKVKNIEEPTEDVLFGGYEVKNWDFSPRIYKIIGSAAVFNLLALFVIGQTNMLATSACDSPFVDRVCQVLDTVYVGSKLYSNDVYGKDGDYIPTTINPDEVVWIPEDGITPPISYPEGYFEVANRDEIAARKAQEDLLTNGFNNSTTATNTSPFGSGSSGSGTTPFTPTQLPKKSSPRVKTPVYRAGNRSRRGGGRKSSRKSSGSLINKKAKYPKKGKEIDTKKVNNSLFSVEGSDSKGNETNANKNGENNKKTPDKNAIAENTAKTSKAVKDDVNKLPLELYVIDFLDNKAVKEIDIKKPFAVKFKGQLNEDGTFKVIRPLVQNGDPAVREIVNEGVAALGDSKFLHHLANLDVKDFELMIVQNDNEFIARIVSIQKSSADARIRQSGLNSLISIGKATKNAEINGKDGEKDPIKLQGEKDELYLLENTSVTSQDKNFILTIKLSRAKAQEMINRRLENEAKKREKDSNYGKPDSDKPNSSAKTAKLEDNKAK